MSASDGELVTQGEPSPLMELLSSKRLPTVAQMAIYTVMQFLDALDAVACQQRRGRSHRRR